MPAYKKGVLIKPVVAPMSLLTIISSFCVSICMRTVLPIITNKATASKAAINNIIFVPSANMVDKRFAHSEFNTA